MERESDRVSERERKGEDKEKVLGQRQREQEGGINNDRGQFTGFMGVAQGLNTSRMT
jgi:hypothetical protein